MKEKDITENSNNQWFSCGLKEDQELSTEDSRRQSGVMKKSLPSRGDSICRGPEVEEKEGATSDQ